MTRNEIDLWLKGIAPENRLALTFLHTPFNSPLVLIDAGDEVTDSVIEDCRQLGSDASDFVLPEPFDGYGLFRVYGEFIPCQNFETSDLPTYRLHKVVKLMDNCDIHAFLSKPAFFCSGKRLVSAKALLRLVTAKENYDCYGKPAPRTVVVTLESLMAMDKRHDALVKCFDIPGSEHPTREVLNDIELASVLLKKHCGEIGLALAISLSHFANNAEQALAGEKKR